MEKKHRVIHLMGTVINLLVVHESADAVLDELTARLKVYEHRFSANDNSSELMQVNLSAGKKAITVHPELFHLIKVGKQHSISSNSNLNIAIGPLVQAWRIGFTDAKVPDEQQIQRLLQLTDPQKIILNEQERSVYLTEPGMLIDLGALAKGYIADLLVDYLKEAKVHSALLDLGGNIVAFGPADNHEDRLWRIGVRNPKANRETYEAVLNVRDQSVVTSGIYERALVKDGKTYHHILDPHTGYPMKTDTASLTIVSSQSIDGEIWTTRLFGKSSAAILQIVEQTPGIEALLITQDQRLLYSQGLTDKIMVNNS